MRFKCVCVCLFCLHSLLLLRTCGLKHTTQWVLEMEEMSESCHIYNKLRFVLRSQFLNVKCERQAFHTCKMFQSALYPSLSLHIQRAHVNGSSSYRFSCVFFFFPFCAKLSLNLIHIRKMCEFVNLTYNMFRCSYLLFHFHIFTVCDFFCLCSMFGSFGGRRKNICHFSHFHAKPRFLPSHTVRHSVCHCNFIMDKLIF